MTSAGTTTPPETTQWKVFLGVGVFIAVIATVYWFSSYEDAGTTMLALASALALFIGTYLWRQDRVGQIRAEAIAEMVAEADAAEVDAAGIEHEAHYLPQSSVWPLAIGIGAAMTLNGLIIGWPYATPGAAVLVLSIAGFVYQGRRRV